MFKPMAKAEHIYFEKDMLFTTPKQFKEAITDYAVHGGWGIKFVKNDLQRIRDVCQEGCKFVAYLTKVPRERSYQLRTLTLEHTCSRSYKNPRCRGRARKVCLGGPSCNYNIFIKTTPHTHIHTFFYYTHTFLFDKLYIYNTPNNNKKSIVILIKIMFCGNLT